MSVADWRYHARVGKHRPVDLETLEAKAALRFILDVDAGRVPDTEVMKAVRGILMAILSASEAKDMVRTAKSIFGLDKPGRPADTGLTPPIIVSTFIERRRRELGRGRGALAQAKRDAGAAFMELIEAGDPDSRKRTIERHWRDGRARIEALSNDDLEALLEPHRWQKLDQG